MKLLLSVTVLLASVNALCAAGGNNYSTANLKSIYTIIDSVKTAENIRHAVKDLPPTFADILLTMFSDSGRGQAKYANPNDNSKKPVRTLSSNQSGELEVPRSSYDFVVDLTRPADIYGQLKAYPVSFPLGKKVYDGKAKPDDQVSDRFIINVLGRYNVGKTYVLRLLANINLGHSFTERTNGISVSLPTPRHTHEPNLALIDTAGSRTPVDYNSETFPRLAYERQISDAFIQEIALNSSEIFLVVINQLTLDDQLYLKMLRKRLKDKNINDREIKQRLFLVHNYFNLRTIEEVEQTARYELQKIFGANKQREGHWLSKDFKHFILANGESEAGRKYNNHTVDQLFTMIKASDAKQVNDVLEHIMYEIERLLGKFLEEKPIYHYEKNEDKKPKSIAATIQVADDSQKELQLSRPHQVGILLELKQLPVEELQPESLWFICPKKPLPDNVVLSSDLKFNEDGSVYIDYSSQFIPDIHIGQLNNYSDIQILIECPSCSEESINVNVKGTKLIVQGEKFNTKMPKDYLNTRRAGKFEFEVPVAKLENEKTFDFPKRKHYFVNGIITIIVPVVRDHPDASDHSPSPSKQKKGSFG